MQNESDFGVEDDDDFSSETDELCCKLLEKKSGSLFIYDQWFFFSLPSDVKYDANEPTTDVLQLVRPCRICFANEVEFAFSDCGHACVCGECVNKFKILQNSAAPNSETWENKCPICNTLIQKAPMRLYH